MITTKYKGHPGQLYANYQRLPQVQSNIMQGTEHSSHEPLEVADPTGFPTAKVDDKADTSGTAAPNQAAMGTNRDATLARWPSHNAWFKAATSVLDDSEDQKD
ncbi:hypothetical protein HGRIS_008780 [Hohenbuehelia grisea]|uniref:Uncharacterized protein n=1 Tax=Hohenbuehelia grisea TaxID=104357 RepID=A0ABR3J9C1_9AGAR